MHGIFQPKIWFDYSGGVKIWDEIKEKGSDGPTVVADVVGSVEWFDVMAFDFAGNVSATLPPN